MKKTSKSYTRIEENLDDVQIENENELAFDYWGEVYSAMCGIGLVILSYCILLYLLSYSKSECPN